MKSSTALYSDLLVPKVSCFFYPWHQQITGEALKRGHLSISECVPKPTGDNLMYIVQYKYKILTFLLKSSNNRLHESWFTSLMLGFEWSTKKSNLFLCLSIVWCSLNTYAGVQPGLRRRVIQSAAIQRDTDSLWQLCFTSNSSFWKQTLSQQ